jgi:hypothetical protein
MLALVVMLAIAEMIQGETQAGPSNDSRDADMIAQLYVVGRPHR